MRSSYREKRMRFALDYLPRASVVKQAASGRLSEQLCIVCEDATTSEIGNRSSSRPGGSFVAACWQFRASLPKSSSVAARYDCPMTMLLSHTTALNLLRCPSLRRQLTLDNRCAINPPIEAPSRQDVIAVLEKFPEIDAPVDALVSSRVNRRPRQNLQLHSSEIILPQGSAVRIDDNLFCSSPEQLLVEMAPGLTYFELVFLMGELFGTYAIAPGLEDGMFERSEPLTTPELASSYLARLGTAPGVAQVRRALRCACARSASPYETRLSMRLGLKPSLGGYHLHVLSMNEPLEVQRIIARLGKGVRKPDVFLGSAHPNSPFSGVAFDYHGKVHEEPTSITVDLERQNELLGINFKVYTLNKDLYDNLDYMDGIVCRARVDLGMPRERLNPRERECRRVLRQGLHDELELIDGVSWKGKLRERAHMAQEELGSEPPVELVPLEAYGY